MMKKGEKTILAIIIISFILGIFLYPRMRDPMVSHWNVLGQPDDYLPKFWGLFLMPIISIGLFLLFYLIPRIDPLKENIEKFRKEYNTFIIIIILFFFYIYTLTLIWNSGVIFSMGRLLTPALAILFYYAGVLIERSKRNWFIGIRTPWTLSSDEVWRKTHQLGGRLFKTMGLLTLLGIFFPIPIFFLIIFLVIFIVVFTTVYSYFEFRKEKSK